jgi:hypothetical protein
MPLEWAGFVGTIYNFEWDHLIHAHVPAHTSTLCLLWGKDVWKLERVGGARGSRTSGHA